MGFLFTIAYVDLAVLYAKCSAGENIHYRTGQAHVTVYAYVLPFREFISQTSALQRCS